MVVPPPIPTPDTLKGVDDLIHAGFEAYRESCFDWLLAATGLVVAGLVLEGPELWHDITSIIRHWRFKRRFQFSLPELHAPNWAKLIAAVGWLAIVVGVAGEYVADSFVSKADGYVQKFDEILLTEAQSRTAFASERASAAYARAAQTEKEAAEDLKTTNTARQKAEEARQKAEGFTLQIAEANKTTAEAKLELAKFKAPRGFHSDKEIQGVIDKCKPFPKTPFIPLVNPDAESARLLRVIDDILVSSCGWIVQSDDVFGFTVPLPNGSARIVWAVTGISVLFSPKYPGLQRPAQALAEALAAAGIEAKAEANDTATNNAVYLLVGQKP